MELTTIHYAAIVTTIVLAIPVFFPNILRLKSSLSEDQAANQEKSDSTLGQLDQTITDLSEALSNIRKLTEATSVVEASIHQQSDLSDFSPDQVQVALIHKAKAEAIKKIDEGADSKEAAREFLEFLKGHRLPHTELYVVRDQLVYMSNDGQGELLRFTRLTSNSDKTESTVVGGGVKVTLREDIVDPQSQEMISRKQTDEGQ